MHRCTQAQAWPGTYLHSKRLMGDAGPSCQRVSGLLHLCTRSATFKIFLTGPVRCSIKTCRRQGWGRMHVAGAGGRCRGSQVSKSWMKTSGAESAAWANSLTLLGGRNVGWLARALYSCPHSHLNPRFTKRPFAPDPSSLPSLPSPALPHHAPPHPPNTRTLSTSGPESVNCSGLGGSCAS